MGNARRRPAPDRRAFVERLLAKHRKLKSTPGQRARDSNLGYLALGEMIAEVSGVEYEEYVRDNILVPLGMDRTGFAYPEGVERATGYQPLWGPLTPLLRIALPGGIVGPRQGRYASFNSFYVKGAAYGGLVGGVAEAARFVMLHLGGEVEGKRLLSEASVAEMRRAVPRGGKRDFGLVPRARGDEAGAFLRRAPRRRGGVLERDASRRPRAPASSPDSPVGFHCQSDGSARLTQTTRPVSLAQCGKRVTGRCDGAARDLAVSPSRLPRCRPVPARGRRRGLRSGPTARRVALLL